MFRQLSKTVCFGRLILCEIDIFVGDYYTAEDMDAEILKIKAVKSTSSQTLLKKPHINSSAVVPLPLTTWPKNLRKSPKIPKRSAY